MLPKPNPSLGLIIKEGGIRVPFIISRIEGRIVINPEARIAAPISDKLAKNRFILGPQTFSHHFKNLTCQIPNCFYVIIHSTAVTIIIMILINKFTFFEKKKNYNLRNIRWEQNHIIATFDNYLGPMLASNMISFSFPS